uniref:Heme oxygenase 1 n=1 Tax=Spermophilus dauricus TaxID=99837 RepID=A0A8C9P1E3_SPEDA
MDCPQRDSLPQDLSKALKEATKEVHAQTENAKFMRNFQRGQVTRKSFKLVMESLYHVYVALEEEIEHNKDNPVLAPLYFPKELYRGAYSIVYICHIYIFFFIHSSIERHLGWLVPQFGYCELCCYKH